MFFLISKILSFLLSPLTWIILLLIPAVFVKNKKISRRFLIACFAVTLFFSNSFIADEVYRLWEYQITPDSEISEVYDAGIVLGGGIVTIDAQTKRMTFRNNPDRFMQALSLYKNKKIKKILFTGGSGSLIYRDMLEASLLRKYCISIGIPDSVILIDSLSDNTYQNAQNSKNILQHNFPDGKYLLITSTIHMKRAMACFEKAGIKAKPYATGRITGKRKINLKHILIPDIDALIKWDMLMHEMFGYMVYSVKGYL